MKATKIGFLILMVLSLVSIPCYGQTAKEYYYTGQDSMAEDELIFCNDSDDNTLKNADNKKAFAEPIVGFSEVMTLCTMC